MTVQIPLTRGLVALVDDEDAEWLGRWKWTTTKLRHGHIYAVRRERDASGVTRAIRMHRAILGAPDGALVDHIDRDTLNNTKANLRVCDRSQNGANRKINANSILGVKGVRLVKHGRYRATIAVRGKRLHLGYFDTVQEASDAYQQAARAHFGIFARLA